MRKALLLPYLAGILCTCMITASAGCARSPIARFYTLSSLTDGGPEDRGPSAGGGVAVGLGPIDLPEYLDRPQIVTRVSPNEVEFAEFERWAEPLKDNLLRTIAGNLSLLLHTDRVALYPWRAATPVDCQVRIDVIRFDGQLGKSVVLETKWTVSGKAPARALRAGGSTLEEPVEGQSYEALVAAQSRALAGLSRLIAEAVKAVQNP
jgi:uncharacterized protein